MSAALRLIVAILIFLSIGRLELLAQSIKELTRIGQWSWALEQTQLQLGQADLNQAEQVELHFDQLALYNRLWQFQDLQNTVQQLDSILQLQSTDEITQIRFASWKYLARTKIRQAYELVPAPVQFEGQLAKYPKLRENLARIHFANGWQANYHRGQSEEAIKHYLKGLDYLADQPALLLRTELFRELGNMYRVIGDFANSLQYYQAELNLYQESFSDQKQPPIAFAHYHIASVHYELGEYQQALKHYLLAEPIWLEKGAHNPRYLRFLLEATGDMYWYLNQNEKALEYYDRAATGQPSVNNDKSQGLTALGDSLSQAGIHAQALVHYQQALDFRLANYGRMHPLSGGCQTYVANALSNSGLTDLALPAFDQAISMLMNNQEEVTPGGEWYLLQAYKGKADLHWKQYQEEQTQFDLDSAYQLSKKGVDLLGLMRQRTLVASSRQQWVEEAYSLFEIAVLSSLTQFENSQEESFLIEALILSDKRKALGLMAAAQSTLAASYTGLPKALIQEEQNLSNAILEYTEKIKTEEQRCQAARPAQMEVWQEKLANLQLQYNQYLQNIRENYPEYYSLKYASPDLNLEQIQGWLPSQDRLAIISSFEAKEEWVFFLISPNQLKVHRIPIQEALNLDADGFIQLMSQVEKFLVNPEKTYREYSSKAYLLYQNLLEPLLTDLDPQFQRLLIIPEGKLANLPWSILLTQPALLKRQYRQLPYLFESFAIAQSPSIALGIVDQKSNGKSGPWFAFAPTLGEEVLDSLGLNQLAQNQPEIEQIFQKPRYRYFLGEAADEARFKRLIPKAGLVHLATHTNIGINQEGQTAILLGPAAEEDGFLTITELYGLTTDADLLVLSACSTAAGDWQMGEGLINFVRASQYAGFQSTLATLWPLEDRTAGALMPLFYEQLSMGKPKDVALQKAMSNYLETAAPDILPPFYWGGVQLYGSSQILKTTSFNPNLIILSFLSLCLLPLLFKNQPKS